jgi:hypothetical protein
MTNATLRGKPDAGNPHVRFDEGEVASAKPRRGSLLYKRYTTKINGWQLVTVAGTVAKAVANFRWRLWRFCGWRRFDAMRARLDVREVAII